MRPAKFVDSQELLKRDFHLPGNVYREFLQCSVVLTVQRGENQRGENMIASFESVTSIDADVEQPTVVQKAGVSLMCFVTFLFLYFIMSGPLAWMEGKMKFKPFSKSVKTVYAPLVKLVESDVKPASSVIKAYVGLFKK
tara:strand:- start:2027 stop:2443 length:417 start_codon:yes stop_codon:yes gene_type:complete